MVTPPKTRTARRALWLAPILLLLAVLASAPGALASTPNFKGSSEDGAVVFFETDEQLVPGDADTKRDLFERSFDATAGAYVTRQVSLGPTGGNDAYPALFEGASADGSRVFFSTAESLVAADTDLRTDVYMRDLASGTTTLVSAGAAGCQPTCGSGAFDTGFAAVSTDGEEVFLVTQEKLDGADADGSLDVYERDLGTETTSLVSAGAASCSPGCGNQAFNAFLRGVSADGTHAFFTTEERLTSTDTDSATDVYARDLAAGTTTLASAGGSACAPSCGNGAAVPVFQASSADGTRAFFTTDEQLVGADADSATDVYARDLPAGPTILVSGGGSPGLTASFAVASADGSHVFFTSAEALVGADLDGTNDVYEWSGGSPALITSAPCAAGCDATFDAIGADSGQLVFSTAAQLAAQDTDSSVDVYREEVGNEEAVLLSRGDPGCPSCWNGAADARFNRASADATHVVFTTGESILPEDGEGEDDIYVRDADSGETSLITTSPSYCPLAKGNCGATFVGASGDGLHVFFATVERFTLDDGDNEVDVYERFLGSSPGEATTRLLSTGNSPNLDLGPPAPLLKGTTPISPAASSTPRVLGEAEAGSRIKVYATANCSGEPVATGTAEELEAPGLLASAKPGSETDFRATAESEGFVSLCSNAIAYVQRDGGGGGGGGGGSTPPPSGESTGSPHLTPHTRITFAPGSRTHSRNPVFRFTDSTSQAGTRFRCKIDRQPWKRCHSPLRLKGLGRGRHVFMVKAVSAAGAREPTPARRAFKVVPR
jgi:Tol biopolymer transport system component